MSQADHDPNDEAPGAAVKASPARMYDYLLGGSPHDPYEIVRTYLDAVPSGSYLVLSHLYGDGQAAQSIRRVKETWSGTPTGVHFRSRQEILRFFHGLELLPPYRGSRPGLAHLGLWGAEDPVEADTDGSRWGLCGVGRKP